MKPYWASPNIKKIGLTRCISSCHLQHIGDILDAKQRVANEACSWILKKNPETEIVALLGSVAHGDIIGWFSDIDLLVITCEPREEEMVELSNEVLFIEYHSWASFEDLLVNKIARDEYESRSSYLFFYGNPIYLHSTRENRERYERIARLGTEALWKDCPPFDRYLDDFIWFYGAAKEALRYNQPMTAISKIQRGTILLLRYYLIKNQILLRKPLPDDRTINQLRNSQVPKELVDFVGQLYKGRLGTDTLLQRGRDVYLRITNGRKWLNKLPV